VATLALLVSRALIVFLILLIARLIMEYVFMFARSWRPSGAIAVALELVYSVTDPPLRALRRIIPPLRLGRVSIDLSFLVLFIVVQILIGVLGNVR